jgi:hypothetical protein
MPCFVQGTGGAGSVKIIPIFYIAVKAIGRTDVAIFDILYLASRLSTLRLLKHPWSSPKNFRFRHCRRSNLDQNLRGITHPDLRSDRGPVVLCKFSKLRFSKSPYEFLNLYGRFCPYNQPYNPGHDTVQCTKFTRRNIYATQKNST